MYIDEIHEKEWIPHKETSYFWYGCRIATCTSAMPSCTSFSSSISATRGRGELQKRHKIKSAFNLHPSEKSAHKHTNLEEEKHTRQAGRCPHWYGAAPDWRTAVGKSRRVLHRMAGRSRSSTPRSYQFLRNVQKPAARAHCWRSDRDSSLSGRISWRRNGNGSPDP